MCCDKKESKYDLNINKSIISFVDSVKLLGIEIDNKLNFEKHVSTIFTKARRQLNAKSPIQKEIIINTFSYSQVMDCPLA